MENKNVGVLAMGYYGNRSMIVGSPDTVLIEILSGWCASEVKKQHITINQKVIDLGNDCYVAYDEDYQIEIRDDEHSYVVCQVDDFKIYNRCAFYKMVDGEMLDIDKAAMQTINKYIVD